MNKKTFEWLTPPYFDSVEAVDVASKNECLIYLVNGEKHLGQMSDFNPEVPAISFTLTNQDEEHQIHLSKIKMIRLVQPTELSKKVFSIESRADSFHPPSERQKFSVEFHDNHRFEGETLGFATSHYGLFLFLSKNELSIFKYFIPFAAIKSYEIGGKIGQILINEKLATQAHVDAALSHQAKLRSQKIGDYFAEHKIITAEELAAAIRHQEKQPVLKLGEALIALGLISQQQLDAALDKQKLNRKIQLGQILINMNVIDEDKLKEVLAKKMGIPFVGLTKFNFDREAIGLIDKAAALRFTVIPLCLEHGRLVVALEDPLNNEALKYIGFVTQKTIVPTMAKREEILDAIYREYSTYTPSAPLEFTRDSEYLLHQDATPEPGMKDLANMLTLEGEGNGEDAVKEPTVDSENTLVKAVNKMILDAAEQGVSDIHIESSSKGKDLHIRFRKDGSLFPYIDIPSKFKNTLISRIKIMAQLDISERRKPQDGKINFQHPNSRHLELRVATIPTNNNSEDVVLRLLQSAKPVKVDNLGLSEKILSDLLKVIQRPHGLILVCGPTGSGKTTTLHSLINKINTPDRKIWTAEDPVEITQPGLSQVQVNTKIGWTFAAAMKSFLRADPDVIMIGEIRDRETANIVIEGSLTGHLVFSTIHTNSATETLVRLLDFDIDPFNFADALQAVLAQRLVKSLCPECKEAYAPDDSELDDLVDEYCEGGELDHAAVKSDWLKIYGKEGKISLFRAKGCPSCKNTGYSGRVGIYELMVLDGNLRRLIHKRANPDTILQQARANGMLTLKQDGILKVLLGITELAQVRTVAI